MCGLSQIFLSYLKFGHQLRIGHCTKQRRKWFSRLEVDGPIFYLYENVLFELTIKRFELQISLLKSVCRSNRFAGYIFFTFFKVFASSLNSCIIHKSTPHYDTAMGG